MIEKLEELLEELYPDQSNQVIEAVENCFHEEGPIRSSLDPEWYKKLQVYVTYPDAFWSEGRSDFSVLSKQIPYIKQLGCNCVHVLPFLSSPMVDFGFDMSDYYLVREELGGNVAFGEFLERAGQEEMAVIMDMVLNHVSMEHRWFLQAQSGDAFYRDFFVNTRKQPILTDRFVDEHGVWAAYQINGREMKARIIFPEQAGELPHWRQGDDGFWYYHTFYPHQLDVDWNNYHVFVAYAKILVFWAKKGLSFRLDAIPFVGKDIKRGQVESTDRTHLIVQAMNQVVKRVNEGSVFLVEANQPTEVMKEYFGSDQLIESELAYNFPLMNAAWVSILTYDNEPLWRCLDSEVEVPGFASWVTFLRNHDELTLEFADPKERELIVDKLSTRGMMFREGFGVSGRTASFLREKLDRQVMAYLLLASLPGNPAIIYGDELARLNDIEFMHHQTTWKRQRFGDSEIADDTRDINRGSIHPQKDMKREGAKYVYEGLSQIYSTRLEVAEFFGKKGWRVERVPANVFGAVYEFEGKQLVVLVNFAEEEVKVNVGEVGQEVLNVGGARVEEGQVVLPKFGGRWGIRDKS